MTPNPWGNIRAATQPAYSWTAAPGFDPDVNPPIVRKYCLATDWIYGDPSPTICHRPYRHDGPHRAMQQTRLHNDDHDGSTSHGLCGGSHNLPVHTWPNDEDDQKEAA